ncbi:MAG: type II toxin-antitoxin system RelB/DinJ family antitoxin [Sulfurimonas sp.]
MSKIQTGLRLDEDKFSEAKVISKSLGLNFTDAVNIFTNMVVATRGLLFDVKLPTKEFKKSIDEIENRDGKSFKSVDALFKDLDNIVIEFRVYFFCTVFVPLFFKRFSIMIRSVVYRECYFLLFREMQM